MRTILGDLLEGEWDCAFHCANVHKVMGSGVAYFLKEKWPEVYEADLEFGEEDDLHGMHKLGLFSKANVEPGRFVYNLYGQQGIGNDGTPIGRNCRYDALYDAMYRACEDICYIMDDVKIGIPWGMGSVRAGGSWKIVEALLSDLEDKFPVEFIIYRLETEDIGQSTNQTK